MIEWLAAIALGSFIGIFTGLIPGIHVNMVSAMVISSSAFLLSITDSITIGIFIISLSAVHTFLDSIPSIYLGAPDAETAMGVLPGHRMLLQGKGYEAVLLTAIGSFGGLAFTSILAPLLILIMRMLQSYLEKWIGLLLIIIVLWTIIRERNKLIGAFVFLLSGSLGIIVFNLPVKEPLFPMLSGLFGLSTMLLSLNDKVNIPKQTISANTETKGAITAISVASIMGSLVGFFPGVGPAQAAVAGSRFVKENGRNFLVLVGGIGTANMVTSLITFYTLDKARSGAIVAVRELTGKIGLEQMIVFIVTALVAGGIGFMLTMFFAKHFSKLIQKVKYEWLCYSVIGLIATLGFILSGWLGIFVLIVSTAIGMIAPLFNVSRSHAMGCLLLPVILWFVL